ncbi:hypothetical protein GOP47_0020021 [Adiantum capillus-veneris]|uniref:Myb/SANT-like DNA-binding domain-containing protein n=1 Tax=Adiantum capillus-veneris TaxID=13818 RepID=A0A9D4UDS1_ADICA|nr:hypothetical protein GOP47_0020021 [Adiantum capillus-veneris]
MSQESGDAQHASSPGLPSPGQQRQQLLPQQSEIPTPLALPYAHLDAEPCADGDANASCRATRSSFPSQEPVQNGELVLDATRGSESPASADKHYKGAWKDEWVVSLIHLRGSLDDEFVKPLKSGLDLWTRICTGMSEAHADFDKNSESCRKKWQRVYKMFKDSKAAMGMSTEDKQMPSKWFDLVQQYMHRHFDANGNAIGGDEPIMSEGISNTDTAVNNNFIAHHIRLNAKRARRDQAIKETLSKMVVTWRESLEVLKDSEAKRLEILHKMSTSMAGLLDTLKK